MESAHTTSITDSAHLIAQLAVQISGYSDQQLKSICDITANELRHRPEPSAERAKKQAQMMRTLWGRYRQFALQVLPILGTNAHAKLWVSEDTGEKRIYFDVGGSRYQTAYYATGNARTAPGTLQYGSDRQRQQIEPHAASLIAACKQILQSVNVMDICIKTAAEWQSPDEEEGDNR